MKLTNVVYVFFFSQMLMLGCSNMIDFSMNLVSNKYASLQIKNKNEKIKDTSNTSIGSKTNENESKESILDKNKIPVIAILTYNYSPDDNKDSSNVELNYVNWLISGGNEVVPIHPWMKEDEINDILKFVNGIVIPGSSQLTSIAPHHDKNKKKIKKILDKTIEMNKISHFPILVIAEAATIVQILIAEDDKIATNYSEVNGVMKRIKLIEPNQDIHSIMMFSKTDLKALSNRKSTIHYVDTAVKFEAYEKNQNLKTTLKVTGVSKDSDDKKYVAMFEGINLPLYGFQFNPEKIPWERRHTFRQKITYSADSVEISQKFLNFFTLMARANNNEAKEENLKKHHSINLFKCSIKEGNIEFNKSMMDNNDKNNNDNNSHHKNSNSNDNVNHNDHNNSKDGEHNDHNTPHNVEHNVHNSSHVVEHKDLNNSEVNLKDSKSHHGDHHDDLNKEDNHNTKNTVNEGHSNHRVSSIVNPKVEADSYYDYLDNLKLENENNRLKMLRKTFNAN